MKKYFIFALGILLGAIVFVAAIQLPTLPTPNSPANSIDLAPLSEGRITPEFKSPPVIKMNNEEDGLLIPIIVYHRIGYASANATSVYKSLTVEPEWFDKHLQYLQAHGFETIQYQDLVAYLDYGAPLPAKPVMINFDDGYKDTYEAAYPILQKHEMRGTLFVTTKSVGSRPYVTWDQIKEMYKSGAMEIGSHTLWHPYLTKSGKAPQEINESKKTLEDQLGVEIIAFAYPFGNYDDRVEKLVKNAGYKIARSFSTGNGINENNRFHVPVIRVYANVGLERWTSQLFPDGEAD